MLTVQCFGVLAIEVGGSVLGPRDLGGIKPRLVFEILVTERGRTLTKERLAELLWGDALPRNPSATLETYVSHVRRALGADAGAIVTEPGGYRADTDLLAVDLDRFDARVTGGGRADLEEALAISARGDVLSHEPFAGWALRLRDVYRRRRLDALLRAADLAVSAGEPAAALVHAEQAIIAEPACERAYVIAMEAHRAQGRSAEAMEVYRRCRARLGEELGTDPLPATTSLRDTIRRGRPAAAPPAVAPAPPTEVPLYGRTRELALLLEAARTALAGPAALLLVEGEAGIGKSRILDELTRRLPTCAIARARCFPLDREIAFAPLASALRTLLPTAESAVRRYPALGEVLPELGPSEITGHTARMRALEAVSAVIADAQPVLLILDDMQWADPSTLAAIGYLLRRNARARLCIVLAFRRGELGTDHPVRGLSAAVHLELQPLTRGELAGAEVADLHDKTGGHPLYIVEYVRAMTSGCGLAESLRDLLVARARAAGAARHRILAVASVLGRSFTPVALARMLDMPEGALLEDLDALCETGLLHADAARFDFRHDLIREALYETLSAPRRRHLHSLAVEALASEGADPGELAHHAEHAGAVELALRHAVAAADAARVRWANVEAAAHCRRALHLATANPGLVEPEALDALRIRLGRLLALPLGRPAEGEVLIAAARADAEARGDDATLFDAVEAMGAARQRGASAPTDAILHAEAALAIAERTEDARLLARAHTMLGSPLGSVGRIDDALEHLHAALTWAKRAGQPPAAFPMGRIALMFHMRTRDREALEWCGRCETAAAAQRDEESMIMARWCSALSLTALGRYTEAWRALDSTAEIGRGEEVFWHARIPNTYGALLAELCLYARALDRDLESLEAAARSKERVVREAEVQTLLNIATDELGLGRLDDARTSLERVRGRASEVEYSRFRWMSRLHAIDAELRLAEGDPERADAAAQSCLTLAAKYGQPKHEVRARIAQAAAFAALDRKPLATRTARAAARKADELELCGLAWRAWSLVYSLGGRPEDRRRADRAILRAAEGSPDFLRVEFLAAVRRDD